LFIRKKNLIQKFTNCAVTENSMSQTATLIFKPPAQPSLRDFGNAEFTPGVETPGYFRNVPLGQKQKRPQARAGGRWGKLNGYFPTDFSSGIRIA
jgi:hypothetical protein